MNFPLLLLLFQISCSALKSQSSPPPNILFILADDLAINDLAIEASPFHETPHIDAIAKGGVSSGDAFAIGTDLLPTLVELTDVQTLTAKLTAHLIEAGAKIPKPDPRFNAAKKAQQLRAFHTTKKAALEREHANFLKPDYQPNPIWWDSLHPRD